MPNKETLSRQMPTAMEMAKAQKLPEYMKAKPTKGTNDLLHELISEIKGMRADMKSKDD